MQISGLSKLNPDLFCSSVYVRFHPRGDLNFVHTPVWEHDEPFTDWIHEAFTNAKRSQLDHRHCKPFTNRSRTIHEPLTNRSRTVHEPFTNRSRTVHGQGYCPSKHLLGPS